MNKWVYSGLSFLLFFLLLFIAPSLQAKTFDIPAGDAMAFQMALTEAQCNGEPDTINLAAGTYSVQDNGDMSFSYEASGGACMTQENEPITVLGAGKGMTIIDGLDSFMSRIGCLEILTNSVANDFNATVVVRGITFANGGEGLDISTNFADVFVEENGFEDNDDSIEISSGFGNLTFNNNMDMKLRMGTPWDFQTGSGDITCVGNTVMDQNDLMTPVDPPLISSGTGRVLFEGNSFSNMNFSSGFSFPFFTNFPLIKDNSFNKVEFNGDIFVIVGGLASDNLIIEGNTFTQVSSMGTGFQIGYSSGNASFTGNQFIDSQIVSLIIASTGSGGTFNFSDNTFTDFNGDQGIILTGGFTEFDIKGNAFTNYNVQSNGFRIDGCCGAVNFYHNTFASGLSNSNFLEINYSQAPVNFTNNFFSDINVANGFVLNFPSQNLDIISIIANAILNSSAEQSVFSVICQTGLMEVIDNILFNNNSQNGSPLLFNLNQCPLTMTNNTILENTALFFFGGGANISVGDPSDTVDVYNNIIFGNRLGAVGLFGRDLYVNNNVGGMGSPVNLFNNDIGDFVSECEQVGAACTPNNVLRGGNINQDPQLRDPMNFDFSPSPGSPVIGQGDPNAPGLPEMDFLDNPLNNPPDMGAVAAVSQLSVSPATINFGNVDTEVPVSEILTLTNNGGNAVVVNDVTLDDNDNFSVNFNPNDGLPACGAPPFNLAGGASCILQVSFNPTAALVFTATLTLSTDEMGNPMLTVALAGSGIGSNGCALNQAPNPEGAPGWFLLSLLLASALILRLRKLGAKKAKAVSLGILAGTLLMAPSTQAAIFTVDDEMGFQAALGQAAINGQADTINLEPGTYSTTVMGTFTYTADSDPAKGNFPLTIIGAGKSTTILDGGGTPMMSGDNILQLDTASVTPDANADIEIRDLTINNGSNALQVNTADADITVENVGFNGNSTGSQLNAGNNGNVNFTGNMIMQPFSDLFQINAGGTGVITVQDNVIQENNPDNPTASGPSLSSTGGDINFTGNQISNVDLVGSLLNAFSSTGDLNFHDNIFSNINFSAGAEMNTASGDINFYGNTVMGTIGFSSRLLGATVSGVGDVSFTENTVVDNITQTQILALDTDNGSVTLHRNAVLGNISGSPTLQVNCNASGSTILTDNIIAQNNTEFDPALTVNSDSCPVFLTNNTITGNSQTGTNGGGVLIFLNFAMASAQLFNNIIFDNNTILASGKFGKDIFIFDNDSDPSNGNPITYSNNNSSPLVTACQMDPACSDNITQGPQINEDPKFRNPNDADFNLSASSPAIGAGDPNAPNIPGVDFNGNPLNNPPDLGALAAASMLSVNPLNLNFGQRATNLATSKIVTLTNNGGLPLNVTGMSLDDTTNYSLDFNPADGAPACGNGTPTIAPGESCILAVVYNPQSETIHLAALTINTDEDGNPTLTVNISGEGVSVGGCSLRGEGKAMSLLWLWIVPLLWLWRTKSQRAIS